MICGRNEREARLGLFCGEGGGPCLCAEAEEAAGAAREFRWGAEIQPPVLKFRAALWARTAGAKLRFEGGRERLGTAIEVVVRRRGDGALPGRAFPKRCAKFGNETKKARKTGAVVAPRWGLGIFCTGDPRAALLRRWPWAGLFQALGRSRTGRTLHHARSRRVCLNVVQFKGSSSARPVVEGEDRRRGRGPQRAWHLFREQFLDSGL